MRYTRDCKPQCYRCRTACTWGIVFIMGLLKSIFRRGAKDRTTLRSISITTGDGITKVDAEKLFRDDAFRKKTARMQTVVVKLGLRVV